MGNMMENRFARSVGMLGLVGVVVLGLLQAEVKAEIKIGCLAPQSGGLATTGVSGIKGAMLAAEEANRAGGVLGQKVALVAEDDQSQSGQPVTIARKFITQDHIVAILGGLTSSETKEMAPLAQVAKIPLLTPSATNLDITKIGNYIFRSCFTDPLTGRILVHFAWNRLKVRTAVILEDVKQDYSVGLSEAIQSNFTGLNGKILKVIAYSSGDTDFRAQLTSIKSIHPDVIFLPGYYSEVALILKQARQLGIRTTFVGAEGWDSPSLFAVAGKAADGNYYANHFAPDDPDPLVHAFVEKYKNKYHVEPDDLSALYYDGAGLLFEAIRRADSTDPARIRDALATTKDYRGVTGNITIDEHRNATKPEVILKIENGAAKMVERVE
jgi:branched-chain amino acid transport system substrate-binding protein